MVVVVAVVVGVVMVGVVVVGAVMVGMVGGGRGATTTREITKTRGRRRRRPKLFASRETVIIPKRMSRKASYYNYN